VYARLQSRFTFFVVVVDSNTTSLKNLNVLMKFTCLVFVFNCVAVLNETKEKKYEGKLSLLSDEFSFSKLNK
jgi:hypothetical protein